MREIKFNFIYGVDGEVRTYHNKTFSFAEIEGGDHFDYVCDCPILKNHSILAKRQFTGLKDKNDVEIYEGDIIDYGFNRLAVIVFWEGRFTFKGLNFSNGNPSAIVDFFRYQVIGNIHENPELLEAKQ
jgi:hypothetical protein